MSTFGAIGGGGSGVGAGGGSGFVPMPNPVGPRPSHHQRDQQLNRQNTQRTPIGPVTMNIPVKDMIFVPLAELTPNRKGFHTEVIVLEVSKQPQIDKSKGLLIFQFIVADRTGSMVLAVWEPSGPLIREGDILRIVQAETKLYNNALQLGVTRTGRIVRIGRYTLQFAELPNHSLYQWKEAGGAGAGHQRQHPHQQQMTQPQYPR